MEDKEVVNFQVNIIRKTHFISFDDDDDNENKMDKDLRIFWYKSKIKKATYQN